MDGYALVFHPATPSASWPSSVVLSGAGFRSKAILPRQLLPARQLCPGHPTGAFLS